MHGTSKKTGQPYDGTIIYVTCEDSEVDGLVAAEKYIPSDLYTYDDFAINGEYEFKYDVGLSGYSRLVSITEI